MRAYAHPVRGKALDLLEYDIASPSELAAALHEPVRVVAYHVRRLEMAGLVTLVEQRQRRGTVEHYYTACSGATISDRDWGWLSTAERRAVLNGGLARLGSRLNAAAALGGFDRDGAHMNRLHARVSEVVWQLAAHELRGALETIERLADRVKRRPRAGPIPAVRPAAFIALCREHRDAKLANGRIPPGATAIDVGDPRVVAARAHPLRAEVFELLRQHEASSSDLARALGSRVANVSYHVRRLAALGLVERTRSDETRGAFEHYYRARVAPAMAPAEWRRSLRDSTIANSAEFLAGAIGNGEFEHADVHFTRTALPTDPQTWEAVADVLFGAFRRVQDAARQRDERPQRRSGRAVQMSVITMLFECRIAPNPAAPSP